MCRLASGASRKKGENVRCGRGGSRVVVVAGILPEEHVDAVRSKRLRHRTGGGHHGVGAATHKQHGRVLRNPVHNASVSSAINSQHIHGTAADLETPTAPNDTAYNDLKNWAKSGACSVACVEPREISPSHYHGDYRGACPAGW
jgi:hypothetical protein